MVSDIHEQPAECDDCGCDLTGEEVHEGECGWFCASCAENPGNECGFGDCNNDCDDDSDEAGPRIDADARAERRQMGLVDF